jgi:hypothetical protein
MTGPLEQSALICSVSGSILSATKALRRSSSFSRAFAEGGDALGFQRRSVALLEGERGFLDQPEQALVGAGRRSHQPFPIGAGTAQARRQALEGFDLVPGVAQLIGESLVVDHGRIATLSRR